MKRKFLSKTLLTRNPAGGRAWRKYWTTSLYNIMQEHWRTSSGKKCVPPEECACRAGVLNSMDVHRSVLGSVVTPRTAVKCSFPEVFLEISHSGKMWTGPDCYEGVPQEECGYQGILGSLIVHQSGAGCFKTVQVTWKALFLKFSWNFPGCGK